MKPLNCYFDFYKDFDDRGNLAFFRLINKSAADALVEDLNRCLSLKHYPDISFRDERVIISGYREDRKLHLEIGRNVYEEVFEILLPVKGLDRDVKILFSSLEKLISFYKDCNLELTTNQ